MASEAARSIGGVANSVVVLSALVAAAGLAIVIGPGYLNPLRFGPYFIAIGTACFFVPGVLGVVGGLFLKREHTTWAWFAAFAGIAIQCLVAAGGFVAQFFFTPMSPLPLILCAIWAAASAIVLWRLIRLFGAVRADANAHRGFVVDAIPVADQIDSVREK